MGAGFTSNGWALGEVIQAAVLDAMLKVWVLSGDIYGFFNCSQAGSDEDGQEMSLKLKECQELYTFTPLPLHPNAS